jgi:hypothetical protein
MDPYMRDGMSKTKPMEKEDSFILMEIFTMDVGKTINPMDKEFIVNIVMGLDIMGYGKRVNHMETDLKSGLIVLVLKGAMRMERNTELEN